MNKLLGYIGIGIVILLIIEVSFSVGKNHKETVVKNKVENGEVVENYDYEMDFETEKRLSDESLNKAAEATSAEAVDRFIYTFHLCISEKDSTCLTNLLSDDVKSQFEQKSPITISNEGDALYQFISDNQTITGIKSDKTETKDGITSYVMTVHLLNEKYPQSYTVKFRNNLITLFSESRDYNENR